MKKYHLVSFYIGSIFLLCLGARQISAAITILIFLMALPRIKKKNIIEYKLYFIPIIFLFSRLLSKDQDYIFLLKSLIFCSFYIATTAIYFTTSFKSNLNNYLFFLYPTVAYLLISFLYTINFYPNLLLTRQILDFPAFEITEWGPSAIYYNIPFIILNIVFIDQKKYILTIAVSICILLSVYYGVRASLLSEFTCILFYLLGKKINKQTLTNTLLSISIFMISFLLYINIPIKKLINYLHFSPSEINLPSIIRNWETPRLLLIKDIFTENFLIKNILGGSITKFSHQDFQDGPLNIFIETYWRYGLIPFLIFIIFNIVYFLKLKNLEDYLIYFGFIITFSLNLYRTWFLILFFIHYTIVIKKHYRTINYS